MQLQLSQLLPQVLFVPFHVSVSQLLLLLRVVQGRVICPYNCKVDIRGIRPNLALEVVTLHLYPTHIQMCPREREAIFLSSRGVIQQWWSWLGPLVLPLGVLWLNAIADCPLLGLVSGALRVDHLGT